MMEKKYNFRKSDSTSTLIIVSSIAKTEVVIDTDVVDSWFYENGDRVPVKTHHERRAMIITNNEKSLKVLQTTKIDPRYDHSYDCPTPGYNENRRKMTDTRIAFSEPIPKGANVSELIMEWVKCFIEEYDRVLSSKSIVVNGCIVDTLELSEETIIYAE